MNAENSKDTRTNYSEIPVVKFTITSGPEGLIVGFDPTGLVNGVELIGLLGTGIYTLAACIAEKLGISTNEVWNMLKLTVDLVQKELPDLNQGEN